MQSELHERLEYLVNYSSQLIFISGDSIAEQQKTLSEMGDYFVGTECHLLKYTF